MRNRDLDEVIRRIGDLPALLRDYPPPAAALEVGCGLGFAMRSLQARVPGLRVIGMNLRPFEGQVPGQEYVYGDAGVGIPLPDASVDVVYSIVTLMFLKDRARFLEEAFRVLRPGGQMRINWRRRLAALHSTDLIEGPEGPVSLWEHVLALPCHGFRWEPGEVTEVLVMERRPGDPPLRLGLRSLDEGRLDLGTLFGPVAEGFMQNRYVPA